MRGKHDQHAGDAPPGWRVQRVDELLLLDGLALQHRPQPLAGHCMLDGHLHPCAVLGGCGAGERIFVAQGEQVRALPVRP